VSVYSSSSSDTIGREDRDHRPSRATSPPSVGNAISGFLGKLPRRYFSNERIDPSTASSSGTISTSRINFSPLQAGGESSSNRNSAGALAISHREEQVPKVPTQEEIRENYFQSISRLNEGIAGTKNARQHMRRFTRSEEMVFEDIFAGDFEDVESVWSASSSEE
jgi:hypothetical protein